MELDEELNKWYRSVASLVDIPSEEKAIITGAGAKVFEEKLTNETNAKHRSNHKDKAYGHAADHVTMQAGNVDGTKTGVSSVGWDNAYHAMNMQRLNDGTKKIKADHFVDNLRKNDAVISEVTAAEAAIYAAKVKKAEADS